MSDFGKILLVIGTIFVAAGALLILLGRTHLPLGRLPGDFLYRSKHTTVYFPLASSLLLSALLSLLLYFLSHLRK